MRKQCSRQWPVQRKDAEDNYADHRETISVGAIDAQRVADALPVLLPQLGIPVDAAGVVGQSDKSISRFMPIHS